MDKLHAFGRTIELCFAAHPYYRALFRKLGLQPGDLREPSDLRRLPVTDKATWMSRPEDFRLELEGIPGTSIEERTLWEIAYTTGSTDRATPFYDTSHDHYARILQVKRYSEWCGVRPDDLVANLFPLTSIPHQGFLSALYGPLGVGARIVAPLSGRGYPEFVEGRETDEVVRYLEAQRPTVLWGVGTFVRRLALRAEELKADLSCVRMAFAMGEPAPPGFRADLRSRLRNLGAGEVKVHNGYGFTEMQSPSFECREGGGFHVVAPELYHFEILDPETKAPVPPGAPGLVVLSHLNRRGTVLLRYQLGDLSAIREDACPDCGREGTRFVRPPVRYGSLAKVKGTLINPAVAFEAISRVPGVEEYQVAAVKKDPGDPYSMDELVVRVACGPDGREEVARSVREGVSRAIEVTPRVEFVDRDRLLGDDARYKFRRFVDERPR